MYKFPGLEQTAESNMETNKTKFLNWKITFSSGMTRDGCRGVCIGLDQKSHLSLPSCVTWTHSSQILNFIVCRATETGEENVKIKNVWGCLADSVDGAYDS